MAEEQQPLCDICNELLTVKHILVDCGTHQNMRNKFNTERSLKVLFKSNQNAEIIQFIKDKCTLRIPTAQVMGQVRQTFIN